jgi:limonene-1,2-epoxide hydrolase
MPRIDPFESWRPLEARAWSESDARTRTLVQAVRDHMEHEIRGDLAPLMATLTREPVYHFYGGPYGAAPMVLSGRAAVEAFYRQMIAAGGNQFEVVVTRIVADSANVVTEGRVKQVHTGKELIAMGRTEIAGVALARDTLVLTSAPLVTVWPGDADGRLVGEDIYFGGDPFASAELITPDDLPSDYRWSHRV